jgi:hypothetical protein
MPAYIELDDVVTGVDDDEPSALAVLRSGAEWSQRWSGPLDAISYAKRPIHATNRP